MGTRKGTRRFTHADIAINPLANHTLSSNMNVNIQEKSHIPANTVLKALERCQFASHTRQHTLGKSLILAITAIKAFCGNQTAVGMN